jgi:V8-like Glu-specific endopeptidase
MITTIARTKVLLALLCLLPNTTFARTPSSHSTKQSRVENGDTVALDNSLHQSVVMVIFGAGLCSASFLSDKVLVTAGHCTSEAKLGETRVYVRDQTGKLFYTPASKITTHPDYKIQQTFQGTYVQNDVGVIEIDTAFPFPVRPLKIGSIDYLRTTEANVTVAGYGLNTATGGTQTLRTGTMRATVLNIPNFYNRDGVYMVPLVDQIVCPGDSGGAVLKGTPSSTTLLAVNSLSNGCKKLGARGNSSSEILSQHLAWIRTVAPSIP